MKEKKEFTRSDALQIATEVGEMLILTVPDAAIAFLQTPWNGEALSDRERALVKDYAQYLLSSMQNTLDARIKNT